ncbi:cytochrome P450 [Lipomyces oligophaga]|uniref:cytochrome P450 n=1 Tax=Lipomyces oligophaga TaxID=45792 RepID=UPI0034CD473C
MAGIVLTKKLKIALTGAVTSILFRYSTTVRQWPLSHLLIFWVSITIAPSIISFFYTLFVYPILSPYKNLPTPAEPPHWLYGHLLSIQVAEKPGDVRLRWMEGNPTATWIRFFSVLGLERILLCTPAAAQSVLMTHAYSFVKPGLTHSLLDFMLGEGLLNAEGEVHKRQRKLVGPAFSFGHIKELVPTFQNVVFRLVQTMAESIELEMADENGFTILPIDRMLHETTLDVIFQGGFGVDINPIKNENHPVVVAYRNIFSPIDRNTLMGRIDLVVTFAFGSGILPSPRTRLVKKSKKIAADFCMELLKEKRQKHDIAVKFGKDPMEVEHDVLNILANKDIGLTDHEIVDNLTTFLAAGHETTSSASAYAVYLLTKHPEVQTKLRQEIRESLPYYTRECLQSETNPFLQTSYEVIENMKYLNNVCREVLRFMPPIPVTNREATKDMMIEGLLIRKGTMIFIAPAALNRLTSLYGADANQFNPDRWDNLPESALHPYAYETFLQGPRSCIGRRFAEMEFKCILIGLFGLFEFVEADPLRSYKIMSTITSKFSEPLMAKVRYA